jgi:outer membrane protein assembly factor BamB
MKTNKTFYLFCIFFLISTTAFCQTSGFQVLNEPKVLGKNHITGSDIVGTELIFPDRIDDFFVDTANHFLTTQLRGYKRGGERLKTAGNILQYDLKKKEVLWSKPIDYELCEFLKFGKLMILNDYNDSYGIDAHTGTNLWKVLNYIYYADPENNIGIAYLFLNGEYLNQLMGIDLLKGKQIWKRSIDRKYGWNDFFFLDDSTLMVVASGLHAINIHTGKGWDYNAIVGEVDNSGAITGAFVGGLIGGLIGGIIVGLIDGSLYYVPTVNTTMNTELNIIRDVVSNTFISGDFIYFASKEKFVKIDKETGNIIWESKLQQDWSSKSSIFMKDYDVYMVNYGYAFKGNRQIHYGKPFLAAFDMLTGKQKYISLTANSKDIIVDYKQIGNEIYLLFRHKIAKYDLITGTKLSEKILSNETFGELQYFTDNQLFVLVNNVFLNLAQYEQKNLHIKSDQRIILSVDEELNVTSTIGYNKTGKTILYYADFQFIVNNNKTFIINKDGKIIAELNVSSKAFIIDDVLYDKRDHSFVAVDLKNIQF